MSRFADAAYEWLKLHAPVEKVPSRRLWDGLCEMVPHLTTPSETRKTPYNTLMRDIRLDAERRFIVGGGFVQLSRSLEK